MRLDRDCAVRDGVGSAIGTGTEAIGTAFRGVADTTEPSFWQSEAVQEVSRSEVILLTTALYLSTSADELQTIVGTVHLGYRFWHDLDTVNFPCTSKNMLHR